MELNSFDVSAFWSYICPMMTQIGDLKRETQDLRLMVSQLQQEVNGLRKHLTFDASSVVQPIQIQTSCVNTAGKQNPQVGRFDLPDDVLRAIFVNCLQRGREAPMETSEAPLVFGRVCSLWRRVAWSTQELWDTLHTTIPTWDRFSPEQQVLKRDTYMEAIRGWLQRSGRMPLSISVTDETSSHWRPSDDERMSFIRRLIEELYTEAPRWKGLKLRLPGAFIRDHLNIDPSNIRMLDIFEIRNSSPGPGLSRLGHSEYPSYDPALPGPGSQVHTIIALPSLRALHLGDVTTIGIIPMRVDQPWFIQPQWPHLRSLSIGEERAIPGNSSKLGTMAPSQAYIILDHLSKIGSQIQICRITLGTLSELFEGRVEDGAPQIHLPSLRELTVNFVFMHRQHDVIGRSGQDPGYLYSFFSALNCPSLESFKYQTPSQTSLPIMHFLQRAQGLKSLRLYGARGLYQNQQNELQRLSLCPHILELHISTGLTDHLAIWDHLPLPSLETLVLDCTPVMDRTSVFQEYMELRSISEDELRISIERERYMKLQRRVAIIKGLCNKRVNNDGELELKEVSFRLSERLRDQALRHLAPFIARGLRITFEDDYYDIPPPFELLPFLTEQGEISAMTEVNSNSSHGSLPQDESL